MATPPNVPVSATRWATSLPRFTWKMAVKTVCGVCLMSIVIAISRIEAFSQWLYFLHFILEVKVCFILLTLAVSC